MGDVCFDTICLPGYGIVCNPTSGLLQCLCTFMVPRYILLKVPDKSNN